MESHNLLSLWKEHWCFLVTLLILITLYMYYTSSFGFFAQKNVKFMKPIIFLGNLGPRLMAKTSVHDFQLQIYDYFRGDPYGGIFEGKRPILYIFDPELVKSITTRDFDYFVDRSALNSDKYLSRSLINLKGSEWKQIRSTLTPAFSSARLRTMIPLIQECCSQMVNFLKDKSIVEMKDAMGHFTLEVIGACAFGIECDALCDENAKFIKVAEKFNYMSKLKRALIFFILIFMPKLFRFINVSFLHHESIEELVRILKAAKNDRRISKQKRNDFLQILIEAAEAEKIQAEEVTKTHLDDETIDAQSLLFLLGGYETTSTLLSFAIHILAITPVLQEKLRMHIDEHTNGDRILYEQLTELDYLEAFLMETLRMYPPLSRVDRVCTKKYTIPGSSLQIDVGDVVSIPVYGIHMDSKIYPDPATFRPERFLGQEKSDRPSHLFLGFGTGPRNCIGRRFAMTSAKLAMVSLMKNFKFFACEKTNNPVKFDKRSILLKAEDGIWVRIEKI